VKYPRVLSEDETIDRALAGASLARFGDGELRLAVGGNCISQRANSPALTAELKAMLLKAPQNCLVCIPNAISATPKAASWARYAESKFTALYGDQEFGSSFVTRPDSAPWIDRPDYWEKIEALWKGRDVVLVKGTERSLTEERCASARSICIVDAPRKDAYADIDRIEAEIVEAECDVGHGPVLMCLGVTATVLAARLALKGVHAIDLGHIGMFRKHAGAYRWQGKDLVSPNYQATLLEMHRRQRWGADGAKHADAVRALADRVKAETILDYGCGRGELEKALAPQRVSGYDPGIPGREGMPKPCDLVVCTDVLEHVEQDRLDNVLEHLKNLAGKALYCVIALRPANAVLPDGRNAHILLRSAEYWAEKLRALGFAEVAIEGRPDREMRVTLCR
jgi:hypothetical protein